MTVLTAEGGKRTVKARGCRRKGSRLAACAQLLVYSEMTLFEYRDYYTLNEAESLQQFWGVKADVEKLALGSYCAQVLEAVAEEGRSDPELLSLILNTLYALDKLNKPQALVKAAFELRLMCLAGYEPLLDACAVCGVPAPEQPQLSLSEGVLCCGAAGPGRGKGPFCRWRSARWRRCGTSSTATQSGCFPFRRTGRLSPVWRRCASVF